MKIEAENCGEYGYIDIHTNQGFGPKEKTEVKIYIDSEYEQNEGLISDFVVNGEFEKKLLGELLKRAAEALLK